MAGSVEGHHPEPGVDQRPDERVELPAPSTPSVHQVHGRRVALAPGAVGPPTPDLTGDRVAVGLDLERVPGGGLPGARTAGAWHGEPEGLGPVGSGG